MARRRDSIPPFEIMRKKPPTSRREEHDQTSKSESQSDRQAAGSSEAQTSDPVETQTVEAQPQASMIQSLRQWWGGGAPIVLRLPRGMALVLVVAAVGLLILAYLTGHSRGVSAGEANAESRFEALTRGSMRGGAMVDGGGQILSTDGQPIASGKSRVFLPGDAEPRRQGLNYPIVARYPLEDAKMLADFIAERGVATLVVSADTTGLFHVIPLTGFTGEGFRAKQHHAAERRLREIGRQWKIRNNNRGDDLSSLWWDKFEPGQ